MRYWAECKKTMTIRESDAKHENAVLICELSVICNAISETLVHPVQPEELQLGSEIMETKNDKTSCIKYNIHVDTFFFLC
jgi:hypothetical protein